MLKLGRLFFLVSSSLILAALLLSAVRWSAPPDGIDLSSSPEKASANSMPTTGRAPHAPAFHPKAFTAPGIADLPRPIVPSSSNGPERLTLQDGPVQVFFADHGMAFTLTGPLGIWGMHWGLVESRPVEPKGEGTPAATATRVSGRAVTTHPAYHRVRYGQLRPGVDLVVEPRSHAVEYSLFCAPGSAPRSIWLRYAGAETLRVTKAGAALEIVTPVGTLIEEGLRCYQPDTQGREHPVAARYGAVRPGADEGTWEYELALADLDPALPLVIDPSIEWFSFAGGSGDDRGVAIAIDNAGYCYVTGSTASTNFPASTGFQKTNAGTSDLFVVKVDAVQCRIVWSTYLGGSVGDTADDIAVDSSGNVIVTGRTASADFPGVDLGFQKTRASTADAFVSKLRADGSGLAWSSYLGGSSDEDFASALAVDPAGNVYVTGYTRSIDFPTLNGFQPALVQWRDAFVTKINADGASLAWSTYLGGSGEDYSLDIALDGSGNIHLTGATTSLNFPVPNGFRTTYPGGFESAFIAKIDATGSGLAWATYLGGSGMDRAEGIALDANGNAYVTGTTTSTNFPATPGAAQTTFAGIYDGFVAKVNATGSALEWATYLGGSAHDFGRAIALDDAGYVVVTGETASTNFPVLLGFQLNRAWAFDAFVTKLSDAHLVWSTYLGGRGYDYTSGIAADTAGDIYLAGQTTSSDIPAWTGFQRFYAGSTDGFVTKITQRGAPKLLQPQDGASIDFPNLMLQWSRMVGIASYQLQVDDGGTTFPSPEVDVTSTDPFYTLPPLPPGPYAWRARAFNGDGLGHWGEWSSAWSFTIVSPTAPDTILLSGPPDPANSADAVFEFVASEPASGFEQSLDGGSWTAGASPLTLTGLTEGLHTFQVRALGPTGNPDPSPAAYEWTIDLTAPDTTIIQGPPPLINSTSATFTLASSEANNMFEWSLDGSTWLETPPTLTVFVPGEGTFQFHARATDFAGNVDPTPATWTWTVDTTPPETTLTSTPTDPTTSTEAAFAFAADEPASSFEWSLDGVAGSTTESAITFVGLLDGTHTFSVSAMDMAGNLDPAPASFT
ncbi:MAG: SBBP repeat-containing protein, partial [Planctomycetes bacterium]|nr:SBBP repeat-containing protein [Planctomycetota bacterium]